MFRWGHVRSSELARIGWQHVNMPVMSMNALSGPIHLLTEFSHRFNLIVTFGVYGYLGSYKWWFSGVVTRNLRVGYIYKELQMLKRKTCLNMVGGILVLIFGCQFRSLQAGDRPEDRKEMARAETGVRNAPEAGAPSTPTPAVVAIELNEMRELINLQRKQIEKLQSTVEQQQTELNKAMSAISAKTAPTMEVAAMPTSPARTTQATADGQEKVNDLELIKGELEAVADSAAQANQRLTKIKSDTAAQKKEADGKLKQLGIFTFGGDMRARLEPFFQEGAQDRHRQRFRLRFNVTGKTSDEFTIGFGLATGSLDDPVSTNQTMTGFLNRKNFGVDKAYISYKPKFFNNLKLDAGKFAYPWYRTGLTFDGDVNPEGFAQTLSFDLKSPVLTNITVVGFQLPFNEVSSGPDSFVYGGQIQAQFRMGSKARLGLYIAGMDIDRADPIAVALAGGSLKPSLSNSNTYRYNSSGAVVGYATKFAYLDAIMKLDLDTHPRFPIAVLFDFVNNMRGSQERSGYWAELTIGKQKEAKDAQFGYSFIRIEKDAVIGAWNESDLRSSTNIRNHRLNFSYMFHSKVTGQFTAWIGKLANPRDNVSLIPSGIRGACTGADVSNCDDSYLKRLQFDVIYKF